MLRALTGLHDAIDDQLATFAPRLERSAAATWSELSRAGRLCPGAVLPRLEQPPSFAAVLAAAIALEERDFPVEGRADQLRRHYLDTMPRMRVEQLATAAAPNAALFHTPLDWSLLPRLAGAIDRLFALVGDDAPTVFAAADAAAFRAARPTLGALYAGTFYGGFMPLLYGYPADLAAIGRVLDGGAPLHAVIDRHLAAPLVHELSHGPRHRTALFPPYLDECVAGHVGVRVLPQFAWPDPGESNALFAAPWFAQVGQALLRAVGVAPVVRAHFGALRWSDALPLGLPAAVARLGWAEHRQRRTLHFLSSNYHPDPWMKLFFLAAAGPLDESLSLADLTALPWRDVPTGPESPFDREILVDALRAMCVRNHQSSGVYLVDRQLPAAPITIDLEACRVSAAPGLDGLDPVPLAYLFPPAVAARLRATGPAQLTLTISSLEALDDLADQILAGLLT